MAVPPQRKIVFITGTRADFGKLKPLIEITNESSEFEVFIFATGMHMHAKYGGTVNEIEKCGYPNIYKYINDSLESRMDLTLASTIEGLSNFCREIKPDAIVIHGDRGEALAGAIVGALNNILVAHIEGGEVSGTIDELIRHSVSKMSHSHFVANDLAKNRLIQMGEAPETVFVIGSPDVDIMFSDSLPKLSMVKEYYDIPFDEYGIMMFHPVTTELDTLEQDVNNLVDVVLKSNQNYIVIFPNNDMGSSIILRAYERLEGQNNIKIFPSTRFEYFLVLLREAKFIIGNSSAGIREAPYYGVPAINMGSRQNNRALHKDIINIGCDKADILSAIEEASQLTLSEMKLFGEGNSNALFFDIFSSDEYWEISKQKYFKDVVFDA